MIPISVINVDRLCCFVIVVEMLVLDVVAPIAAV